MTYSNLEHQILDQLHKLAPLQQRRVLEFAQILSATPKGVPGRNLISFAGAFDTDDLAAMKQAIEEGCEQVYVDEW